MRKKFLSKNERHLLPSDSETKFLSKQVKFLDRVQQIIIKLFRMEETYIMRKVQ